MTRLETAAAFGITEAEYQKALADMRDFGRRRAVDKSLSDYEVDVILGPGDSRINELYATSGTYFATLPSGPRSAADSEPVGYPMAAMPLSYAKFNGRPLGVCAIAAANYEGLLIRLMSAWEMSFNMERQLPTWVGGHPNSGSKGEV